VALGLGQQVFAAAKSDLEPDRPDPGPEQALGIERFGGGVEIDADTRQLGCEQRFLRRRQAMTLAPTVESEARRRRPHSRH
jgi:hypothetical protein